MIFYSPFVYPTIILDRAEFPILFFYEEEGGSVWALRGTDVSFLQVLLDELL